MMVITRARRIRKALHAALLRIPTADLRHVKAFVWCIRSDREWQIEGLCGVLQQASAGLYPVYSMDQRAVPRAQVIFWLPICRLFSDTALLGVVAHELAHAYQASGIPGDWHARMQQRYEAGERDANRIAASWGFGPEIRVLRQERRKTVSPFLKANESRLVREVLRRTGEAERIKRARFVELLAKQDDERDEKAVRREADTQ
jgi:hypothetical protein